MKSRFDQFIKEVQERRSREFKVPSEELWHKINNKLKKRKRLRRLFMFFGVSGLAILIGSYLIVNKESNKISVIQKKSKRSIELKSAPTLENRQLSLCQPLNHNLTSDYTPMKARFIDGSEDVDSMHSNVITKVTAQNSHNRTVENKLYQLSTANTHAGFGFDEQSQIQDGGKEYPIINQKYLNPILLPCPSFDHCIISHVSKGLLSKRFNIGLSTGVLIALKSVELFQNNPNFNASNFNVIHSNSWQSNLDVTFQPSTHIAFKTGIGYGTQHLTNEVKDAIVAYDTITEMLTINSPVSVINVSTTNLLSDDYEDQDGLEFEPDDSSNIVLTYTNKTSVGVINVPLQMSFGFGLKQITLGISGGLNLSYLKNASTEVSFTGYSSPKYSIQNNLSKVSIGTKLDLGIEFALTESFNFTAALNYFHTLTPYLIANSSSVKPVFLGFNAGIKYVFH